MSANEVISFRMFPDTILSQMQIMMSQQNVVISDVNSVMYQFSNTLVRAMCDGVERAFADWISQENFLTGDLALLVMKNLGTEILDNVVTRMMVELQERQK